MSVITAAAVGLSLSSAHALAQADQRDLGAEIADEQQARNYAIEMVSTNFPASQAAAEAVSYTHLTLPTTRLVCRSRWSPYH